MAEIQTAYVRIRPITSGFRGEATRQLRPQLAGVASEAQKLSGATRDASKNISTFTRGTIAANAASIGFGRALTFASTAFLGGAGLGALIRTATDEFSENVRVQSEVQAGLQSTAGVANITAAEIDSLATSTLKLTGIDDELVKQAASVLLTFRSVRNEVGAGNDVFTQATKLTADLAQRFRRDLSSTAIQLGKALQDPIRGITALRRQGVQFTVAQQKQIAGLVKTGQLLTAQKLILREVETQVGGTAEAFGRTLPGQLNILRETATNTLGDLVRQLTESEQAAGIAEQGISDLRSVFGATADAARLIGPPLLDAATAARGLVDAIGAPVLLGAVAAYKGVGIATTIAGAAQARYNAILAAGIPVTRGATVSTLQYATAQTVATRATGVAAGAGGIRALGAGLLATVGKANLVTIAVAATAAGIIYLNRQQSDWDKSHDRTRRSLGLLDGEIARSTDLRRKLSSATAAVETDKLAISSARLGVEQARQNLANERSLRGSLQYRLSQLALAEAQQRLRVAEGQLASDRQEAQRTEREQAAAAETRRQNVRRQIGDIRELIDVTRAQAQVKVRTATDFATPTAIKAIRDTALAFDDLARSQKNQQGAAATAARALAVITRALNEAPTEKQINVVINAAAAGKSLQEILVTLGFTLEQAQGLATPAGVATGAAFGQGVQTGLLGEGSNIFNAVDVMLQGVKDRAVSGAQSILDQSAILKEQQRAANAEIAASQKALQNVREIRRERSKALIEQRDALQQERESLAQARQSVLDAQQALADAIRAGNQAVTDAVSQAKQNLSTIGQSLSSAIQEFLNKTGGTADPKGPLAKRFAELRKRILEGQGGPETQRAAQEIAARLQAQQVGQRGGGAEQLEQRFADTAALFNRGSIGLQAFNRRINQILKELGVSAGRVEARQGPAAGEEIRALIRAIREQALAIATGPQRPGAGLEVSIVRPIETLRESQRQIAQAERQLAQAHLDVSRSQRDLNRQQLVTQRATYAQIAAMRAEARVRERRRRAEEGLTRGPKGRGKASEDARDNARSGANAP
jgi:hypothetical protein